MKAFKKTITLGILIAALLACNWLGRKDEGTGEKEKIPDPPVAEAAKVEEKPEAPEWPTREKEEPDDQILEEEAKEPEKENLKAQEPQIRLYDIPLGDDLQEFTFRLCQKEGIDYELTLALMDQESSYRTQIISRTNDYGLMQINTVNHKRLREELGISDFLNPEENIQAGTSMLGDLFRKYEDPHKVLMAYNHGEGGARKHWNQGTYTSRYSRSVTAKAEALKERRK